MPLALLSLLILVVAVLVARAISRERREYGRFKRLRSTAARKKVYARWLRDSFFTFGGMSAIILLASWDFVTPALVDAQSWGPLQWALGALGNDVGRIVLVVVAVLLLALVLVPIFLLRGDSAEIPTIGDVGALLPRTRGELGYGFALGSNAGLVEELMFRLALPALIFGVTGDGLFSFVAATVLFGLLHLYQGVSGVISSMVLGLVFCAIYLLSGSIVLVIVLHALFDLRSLVLIPVVVMQVHKKA